MEMSMTLTYGAGSVVAAVCALAALMQRFGVSPIVAAQGTSVPAAAAAALTPNAVDRKADHRVLPRGRRL